MYTMLRKMLLVAHLFLLIVPESESFVSEMERKLPIRVLHVIGAMDRGGAETFIMNVYRSINRTQIQFDFLVHEDRECAYDVEIKRLGGNIYRLPRFTGFNLIEYRAKCRRFFKEHHDFAAVHGHIGSSAAIYLSEAKRADLFTVAHSHGTNAKNLAHIPYAIVSYPTRHIADVFFACSSEAGVDRFGQRVASQPCFRVVNNGIDVERFRFSQSSRNRSRSALLLCDDAPVFCHVGRFVSSKNHQFLLEVFACIVSTLPNARLLLIGGGSLEYDIRKRVERLGLSDRVLFLGVQDDVASALMASDVFIFPSLWEGLGIAAIEAQASGLPCLLSSSLPEMSKVTPGARFLKLEEGTQVWAREAIKSLEIPSENRSVCADDVKQAGFDIADTTSKLSAFYLSHQLW